LLSAIGDLRFVIFKNYFEVDASMTRAGTGPAPTGLIEDGIFILPLGTEPGAVGLEYSL
jgi:hypothetical protein